MRKVFYILILSVLFPACSNSTELEQELEQKQEEQNTESQDELPKVYKLKTITMYSTKLPVTGITLTDDFDLSITRNGESFDKDLYDFLKPVFWPNMEKERKEYLDKFQHYLPEEKKSLFIGFTTIFHKQNETHSYQVVEVDDVLMVRMKSEDLYKLNQYRITHVFELVEQD